MLNHSTSTALASLVGLSDLMIASGEQDRAVRILAFVIQHPEASPETLDRAEDLFIDLEAELCPRVIWDAKEWAKSARLADILFEVRDDL